MSDLIDWVEKQALENLRFRLQDTDNLAKESNTTLTILLAALGAGAAYSVKLVESQAENWLIFGAVAFSSYMLVVSVLLIYQCMKISEIPAPTNEPNNLYQPEFSLDLLRETELKNVQERINQAVTRNMLTATRLNRIRQLAIASPIIFATVAALAAAAA